MNNERLMFRVWDKHDSFMICDSNISQIGIYQLYIDISGEVICIYEGYKDDDYETISMTNNPDRFIIEQCLGLKDRNGKLIFEGDILRKVEHTFLELSNTSDVYLLDKITVNKRLIKKGEEEKDYSGYSYVEVWYYGKTDVATMERFPYYWLKDEYVEYEGERREDPKDWEVVGNIHENPELLKNQS